MLHFMKQSDVYLLTTLLGEDVQLLISRSHGCNSMHLGNTTC